MAARIVSREACAGRALEFARDALMPNGADARAVYVACAALHLSEWLEYELVEAGYDAQRSSASRKGQPIATGVIGYFPGALTAVAERCGGWAAVAEAFPHALAAASEVSRRGNDKHNPGEPLHWAREKSTDEADSALRHIIDSCRDPLGLDDAGNPNLAAALWRTLAWLERVLDNDDRWRTVAKPAETPA